MITSIELQVISKILTTDNFEEADQLLSFDSSYYSLFRPQIEFIQEHVNKFGSVPDVFTFQSQFPDVELVQVSEPMSYLTAEIKRNKQHIILLETFNKIKDLDKDDVKQAWEYIEKQYERASQLDESQPMDIIHQANERSQQILEFNKQARIPTGLAELDKLMYGGLSTVEELLLVVARTNSGKSWILTKMMESAQRHGFPVLYYSPEMQSSFLGTRFDTWRGNFKNSELYQGKYTEDYLKYIMSLPSEETSAYILEDKDAPDGVVTVPVIKNLVRKNHIKLVIIDGLSYMEDVRKHDSDSIKYKNLCNDLFRMSKEFGCAVVVAMQANRDTRNNVSKTEDGKDNYPSLYNVESSDHPGRICTQAFVLRQVFDKHILDIKMEKSRNAANHKAEFSYSWDPNTGNMSLIDDSAEQEYNVSTPVISGPIISNSVVHSDDALLTDDDDDEEVEF